MSRKFASLASRIIRSEIIRVYQIHLERPSRSPHAYQPKVIAVSRDGFNPRALPYLDRITGNSRLPHVDRSDRPTGGDVAEWSKALPC